MVITYSDKLKNPKWQKKRLQVLDKANFICELCQDTDETLQVHHLKYLKGKEPWEYDLDNFKCLCESCHKAITILSWIEFKDIYKVFKQSIHGHNNVYIGYLNNEIKVLIGIAICKEDNYPIVIHSSLTSLFELNKKFNGI
jgi:hypothetical protein